MTFARILFVPKVGGEKQDLSLQVIEKLTERFQTLHRRGDEDSDYKGMIPVVIAKVIDDWSQADELTLVIAVGGDGTMLYAAKKALETNSKVLGINLGNVGFLTDIDIAECEKLPDMIYDYNLGIGDVFVEDTRSLLEVAFDNGVKTLAINDVVISDRESDAIISYDLKVGKMDAGSHKANSVIVATPTGSTAYAMNVGGSIIEPSLNVMEIVAVAPITMAARPILVGSQSTIEIAVTPKFNHTCVVRADGQNFIVFDKQETIKIRQHKKKVCLVHIPGWNFFTKMSMKLGWNRASI